MLILQRRKERFTSALSSLSPPQKSHYSFLVDPLQMLRFAESHSQETHFIWFSYSLRVLSVFGIDMTRFHIS